MPNRDEVSYYPEIIEYFERSFKSDLHSVPDLEVCFKIGNFSTGLKEVIEELNLYRHPLKAFSDKAPRLKLDIFGVVFSRDGFFRIVIVEVKLLNKVGLQEFSQLVGYCISSDVSYGILINVDGSISNYLEDILLTNDDVSFIKRIKLDNSEITHSFGVMQWQSKTRHIRYINVGTLNNLSSLCNAICLDYSASFAKGN